MKVYLQHHTLECSVEEYRQLFGQPSSVTAQKESWRGNVANHNKRRKEKKKEKQKEVKAKLRASLEDQVKLAYNPFLHQVTGITRNALELDQRTTKQFHEEKQEARKRFMKENYSLEVTGLSYEECCAQVAAIKRLQHAHKPKYDDGWYDLRKQIENGDVASNAFGLPRAFF